MRMRVYAYVKKKKKKKMGNRDKIIKQWQRIERV